MTWNDKHKIVGVRVKKLDYKWNRQRRSDTSRTLRIRWVSLHPPFFVFFWCSQFIMISCCFCSTVKIRDNATQQQIVARFYTYGYIIVLQRWSPQYYRLQTSMMIMSIAHNIASVKNEKGREWGGEERRGEKKESRRPDIRDSAVTFQPSRSSSLFESFAKKL